MACELLRNALIIPMIAATMYGSAALTPDGVELVGSRRANLMQA